jgi:NAD-dependent dihydropyrimidine dehydrogenase PreA subunit
MTYVITEPCIGHREASCVEVCPVDCIIDVGQMFVIDPVECIDCGACEPECPHTAIFSEDAVPGPWQPYVEINARIEDGAQAVEALLARGR